MTQQKITTAAEALDYIDANIAIGLTPVMAGTKFYRHSFSQTGMGFYIEYLDERGTVGRCLPKNVTWVFDFVFMGLPVAGSLPGISIPVAPPELRGRVGVAIAVVPGRRKATLLEAAEAALMVMADGAERDDLAEAVARERRTH